MASTQQPLRRTAYSPMFVTSRERNFQLPALNIPSHSIASGTSIPEPTATPPAELRQELEMQDGHAQAQDPNARHAAHPSVQSKPVSRGGLSLSGIDGAYDPASSQPQTPRALDSPNPLRSHPTSTHSLSRQFQLDGQQGAGTTASPNGSAAALSQAYHNGRAPSPGPVHGLAQTQSHSSHKRPHTQGSSMSNLRAPHKRQHTNESMDQSAAPPTKRPMSVRKFLGLRALSNAFGRSSSDKKREDGAGGGGGGGVYATHTGHARNKSADKLSLFSLSLSARRPESRLGLASSHGRGGERPESRAQTERGGPTLSRRRSSLMLLRGAFGLGGGTEEQPHEEARQEQHALEQQYEREQQDGKRASTNHDDGDNSTEERDVPMRDARTPTPPPTLPGLSDLKATKGLHEAGDGAFFGDEDMFKDIQ